jgi:hypothetical protein
MLFDLPIDEEPLDRPRLYFAAAGAEAGWRRAAMLLSTDGGASWKPEVSVTAAAAMGMTVTPLLSAHSPLLDLRNSLEVELLNEAMWLGSRNDSALAAGANLAVVGNELVQFGIAEPLGARRFRLSRLLRGRRGTERLSGQHPPGSRFLLVEREKLSSTELQAGLIGAEVMLLAQGVGDGEEGVLVREELHGTSIMPLFPVHFSARRSADGDIRFQWTRRSRRGWSWLSGSDTPLGEEQELYQIVLSGGTRHRVAEVGSPSFVYTAAQQAEDGASTTIHAELCQIGTHGRSRRALLTIL